MEEKIGGFIMFCSNCGQEVPEDAKVCNVCGKCILLPLGEGETVTKNDGQAIFCDEELQIISKQNKPLSTLSFIAMQLLFLIPILNVILLLVWSFRKNTNANRKAYARSALIWFLIFCVVLLFIILTFIFMGYPISINAFIKILKNLVNAIPE